MPVASLVIVVWVVLVLSQYRADKHSDRLSFTGREN